MKWIYNLINRNNLGNKSTEYDKEALGYMNGNTELLKETDVFSQ